MTTIRICSCSVLRVKKGKLKNIKVAIAYVTGCAIIHKFLVDQINDIYLVYVIQNNIHYFVIINYKPKKVYKITFEQDSKYEIAIVDKKIVISDGEDQYLYDNYGEYLKDITGIKLKDFITYGIDTFCIVDEKKFMKLNFLDGGEPILTECLEDNLFVAKHPNIIRKLESDCVLEPDEFIVIKSGKKFIKMSDNCILRSSIWHYNYLRGQYIYALVEVDKTYMFVKEDIINEKFELIFDNKYYYKIIVLDPDLLKMKSLCFSD